MKTLKKYDLEIIEKEGQKEVEVPDEVIDKANLLWDDFLIGKFLDTAMHIAKFHVIVNKIWSQGDILKQIDVYEVDSTTMKFGVFDPSMRARFL